MKSELLSQEKNVVTVKITIPAEDFSAQVSRTIASVGRKANIPGFRKGKAPRRVVEMRFGKEALRAEALEEMLAKTMEEVSSEYDLEPIDEPKVDVKDMEEGHDVVLEATFEVKPEVTLPEFGEITAEKPSFVISDQMVADGVENVRRSHGEWKTSANPSASGDRVKAAYTTTIKDDAGSILSSHEPKVETFTLDSLSLKQEIVDALLGAVAGDKRHAEVRIDDSYQDKALAGKMACYDFDVQEILELEPAALTPELFKKATGKDLKTEDELKAHLRSTMEERLESDSRRAAESDALKKICQLVSVELPETMVQRQKAHLLRRAEENVKNRTGLTLEEYYAQSGQDFEGFKSQLDTEARNDVKEYLVMDACTEKFGVNVQPEDLDKEIETMAANYHVAPESVKAMLQKKPDDLRSLISSAKYRKTLDAVMGAVKTVEVNKNAVPEAGK